MRRAAIVFACLLIALVPAPARAHLVDVRFGDFYGGALHVLTGLQYVLLLFALSFLAAVQPRETGRWMLFAAPVGMLIGGFLAVGSSLVSIPVLVTAGVVVAGMLTTLGRPLPAWGVICLGVVAAGILGFENGLAMTEQSTVYLFVFGLTAAALLVITLLTACLVLIADLGDWGRIGLRAIGSWIGAVSLMVMALSLAGPVRAAGL